MRHLVTGGGGFIGSALVRELARRGDEVIAFDRFTGRGKWDRVLDISGAIRIQGDIRDPARVSKVVGSGVDVVWHLAYIQGTQNFYAKPQLVLDVALTGILNVLNAARTCVDPPQMVLVSSSETYQNPPEGMYPTPETVPLSVPDVLNPRYSYGGGKIAQELAVLAWRDAGALGRTMILRPHNVYGADMGWEHVIPQMAQRMVELPGDSHRFRIMGTGEETRSFCYVTDCIRAMLTAFDHGEDRNVYHVGNPEEIRMADLARLIAEHFHRNITIEPSELAQGSPTRRVPSIKKLRALGYEPAVPLSMGLSFTLSWYDEAIKHGLHHEQARATE